MADGDDLINKINNIGAGASSSPAPAGGGSGTGESFMQGLTEGATQMANGAQQMLASAQSGQLKFDPDTGQALIKTLTTHIQDLEDAGRHVERISQRTPLSTTAGGAAMAGFNESVASTGGQAFAPAHHQFVDGLKSAVRAIQIAMDNYAKTDADNAGTFKTKG